MNDAGTGRGVNIVREEHGREAAVALIHLSKRMAETDAFERRALHRGERRARHAVTLQSGGGKRLAKNQEAAAGIDQLIAEFGVNVQGLVRGNGPRGRGPDHDRAGLRDGDTESLLSFGVVLIRKREGNVKSRPLDVLIFHFSLSERALAVEAPVHGLQAAVHVALLHDFRESADFARFRVVTEREIRIAPVGENAEALEVLHLTLHLLVRVGAALGLTFFRRQVLAVLLLDLNFDRHAVAVPARNVRHVVAFDQLRLVDDVLQDLVHRVAKVNVPVRIRGAVMQQELLRALTGTAHDVVNVLPLPLVDPGRLTLGEAAAHRERRVWKVERILLGVFSCFGHIALISGPLGLFGWIKFWLY